MMTVHEYQSATNEIRALQSQLAASELAALRKKVAELKTLHGKRDQNRRAQHLASQAIRNARLAKMAEEQYFMSSRYGDTPEIGRARLEAATAEWMGLTIEEYRRREAVNESNRKSRERIASGERLRSERKADQPRHGSFNRYQSGCRCEPCRKANANRMRNYRAARKSEAKEQAA